MAREKIISLNKNSTNNNSDFESGAPVDSFEDGMANFLPRILYLLLEIIFQIILLVLQVRSILEEGEEEEGLEVVEVALE